MAGLVSLITTSLKMSFFSSDAGVATAAAAAMVAGGAVARPAALMSVGAFCGGQSQVAVGHGWCVSRAAAAGTHRQGGGGGGGQC
jgi:hypothetical protein